MTDYDYEDPFKDLLGRCNDIVKDLYTTNTVIKGLSLL
jgi:hypothetical protein